MRRETRTVVYDDEPQIEACRFEGTQQPFPNRFHERYVTGFVEHGRHVLSCKNKAYSMERGSVILFKPRAAVKSTAPLVRGGKEPF